MPSATARAARISAKHGEKEDMPEHMRPKPLGPGYLVGVTDKCLKGKQPKAEPPFTGEAMD